MSEALTRLASRALGLSGTVRPRPASRFSDGGMDQPLPGFAGEPLAEAGQAAPERAMSPRLAGQAPPSEARAAGDADPSLQTKPESEPVAGQSMTRLMPIADVVDGRSARPLPSLRATPELLVAAPAGEFTASPVPARPAPDRPDPAPFSPAPAQADAAPYQPLLPPRADNPTPPPPAPAIHAAPSPTPAPPDIQISIGRIEVRAEKPEPRRPPAAPPRARPALMSLDDYLARGRGRR